ncbi:MAG: GNAT family N-acetyltransferase [Hyphomicrobiales bacterium]|nr:GNAT family N-acetyltransferase [Hyphomicrobiales bacterium]
MTQTPQSEVLSADAVADQGNAAPTARFPKLGRRRNLHGLPASLARLGALELRLAVTKNEIRKAQHLRWNVFVRNGGARVDYRSHLRRRDICPFDRFCDHLIVVDHEARGKRGQIKPKVVGTYRLLRQEIAEAHRGFYSASEFDISGLLARHPGKRFLELGRSCILPEYRARKVLELLWRGLWIYSQHHDIDVMVGCASLPGIDLSSHREVLAGIYAKALAGGEWRVAPLPGVNEAIRDICKADDTRTEPVSRPALPPLVKGYLRLGACFGEGVFIDRQFGTTDVFVVLPVNRIDRRYIAYFSAPLESEQKLAA